MMKLYFLLFLIFWVPLRSQNILQETSSEMVEAEEKEHAELSDGEDMLADLGDESCEAVEGALREIVLVSDPTSVKPRVEVVHEGLSLIDLVVPGKLDRLEAEMSGYFGLKINRDLILDIRSKIISYFKENGEPLVVVSIPPQDITEGVLQIVVIPSRVDHIIISGGRYFPDSQISKMLRVEPGDVVNSYTLFQDVDWINRSPYRNVDLIFSPGTQENTTDLEIRVSDRFPMRVYAGVDNTGSVATGHTRWFGGFSWANIFHLDHTFAYQGTASSNFENFYAHTLNYIAPLSNRHILMFFGGYSQVKPDISNFRSKGASTQVSGRYQIPMIGPGTSPTLREFSFGADFKNVNSNLTLLAPGEVPIVTSHIKYVQFMAGYSMGLNRKRHTMSLNAQAFASPGFWDSSNQKFNELRLGAKNTYLYGRFMASYTYAPEKFSFSTMVRGQVSTAALLPPEQYGVGGYDTVRGYREREINADDVFILNLELRSPKAEVFSMLWKNKKKYRDEIMIYGFFDYAYTAEVKTMPQQEAPQDLYSIGPGLKYNFDPFFSLRIDWGIRLKATQFEEAWGSLVHFGLLAGY